jgi:uncharacterized repeat protein (TIGR03803 family)
MRIPFECRGWSMRASRFALVLAIVLALAVEATPSVQAQGAKLQVLYAFGSQKNDGSYPDAALTSRGAIFYGTTASGGEFGNGTVFKLTPQNGGKWTETVLHSFVGSPGDGAGPHAGLVRDAEGNFWGTTQNGGSYGFGTIVQLYPESFWVDLVFHSFSRGADGGSPNAGVVLDKAGNKFGTTPGSFDNLNFGTVFEYSKDEDYTVLYTFKGGTDGSVPYGGLVQDKKGNLYGATGGGGAMGFGTVFEVDTTGKETVLYSFLDNPDGVDPNGTLVMDSSGNLYGTTEGGGTANGGTVFKLSPPATQGGTWTESVLYSFKGGTTDGEVPLVGVILDSKGNLYGTTEAGGSDLSWGTVFKVDASGNETVLWAFTNGKDGGTPAAPLLLGLGEKYLYGTTTGGGAELEGVVFRIAVP